MPITDPPPNPYAAPQAPLASSADPRSWVQRSADEWHRGAWPLVFLLNLGVPILFGYGLCSNAGFLGVVMMTAILFALSSWLVAGNPLLRARLLVGGKIVALFQFLPFFHFVIGFVAMLILSLFNNLFPLFFEPNFHPLKHLNFWPASLATLFTGSGLMAFAYLIGRRHVSNEGDTSLVLPPTETSDSSL